jgi:Na+/melibiose symporter-like transporter
MNGNKTEKTSALEMLSFGGTQFATSIYMAFLSYYLMAFCTDIALIPAAVTAVLLFCFRLFSSVDGLAIGLFINRKNFKDGKYRPYLKWCSLPFAISLAALGLAPGVSITVRVFYIAIILVLCDLCWSMLQTASMSMLPFLVRDDISRAKFTSFSNGSAITAYIIVGTFTLPLVNLLGGGNNRQGYALTLAMFAIIALPLIVNAYIRLKEKHYSVPQRKPAIRDIFLAIGHNKRIMLFFAGFCLYSMADAFKNTTTYYYVTHIMGQPDLLPMVISAGLLSPLAVQPIIPRLLKYAKKETLIAFGLFASSCSSLLMLAAGTRPLPLIACVVLYGVFTAVVSNLVYTVIASFTDEMLELKKISMSEILMATMNLSSNIGVAVSSGTAAMAMAAVGYSAQAAIQTAGALFAIKMLYILCTATGLALSGVVMLLFNRNSVHTLNQ